MPMYKSRLNIQVASNIGSILLISNTNIANSVRVLRVVGEEWRTLSTLHPPKGIIGLMVPDANGIAHTLFGEVTAISNNGVWMVSTSRIATTDIDLGLAIHVYKRVGGVVGYVGSFQPLGNASVYPEYVTSPVVTISDDGELVTVTDKSDTVVVQKKHVHCLYTFDVEVNTWDLSSTIPVLCPGAVLVSDVNSEWTPNHTVWHTPVSMRGLKDTACVLDIIREYIFYASMVGATASIIFVVESFL